jgi:hypothetical protein
MEAVAGLGLLLFPSQSVSLFLGSAPDVPGLVVTRVTGAALLALALACWQMRHERGSAARGVIAAALVYDVGVVVILVHAGLILKVPGIGVWLGALLHSAMSLWCLACLRRKQGNMGSGAAEEKRP